MLVSAIKGFNHEWAAVTSLQDYEGHKTGWKLQTECGIERRFPDSHWEDPYGAAIRAMEGHRCGI